MKVEFTTQSGRDQLNPAAQTGRLINCYREPLVPGGKGQFQLRAVPGMEELADLGRVFMRALNVFDGDLLTVCGGTLSSVAIDGTATDIGAVGETEETGISENTGYATIVADGDYYTWDGTTLATVDPGFPVASVGYIGGYTVVTELNGRRLAWSDLADPTTFPGLNFASAEIDNLPIIRGIILKDIWFLFKASGFEMWGVTDLAGARAFQRISGAMGETGLAGYSLITTFPDGMAFVGTDGRVNVWSGGIRPISTPPVEVALTECEPQSVFYYTRRGHGFICVTFKDCPAWCYDIATGEWHEREQAGEPWTARKSVKLGDDWFVGTAAGKISKLVARCRDHDDVLVRTAVSTPLAPGKPFIVSSVSVYPVVGQHLEDDEVVVLDDGDVMLGFGGLAVMGWGDDTPASVTLSATRNGVEFGPPKARSLGARGDYSRWISWRALGQFRRMGAFKLVMTATQDVPILSAAEVEIA
jgi:hypothetical protein